MTGLKQIENQRRFEALHAEAKEEPSYKLLEKAYPLLSPGDLKEQIRVYLATGILENPSL